MAFRLLFKRMLSGITKPVIYSAALTIVNEAKKDDSDFKIKFEPPDIKNLTHEFMIKQSVLENINSVTQALTVAYAAIEYASNEYRRCLAKLISLTKETLMYNVSDSHLDDIIAMESEVATKKQSVADLVIYMDCIQKMGVATAEASFAAGLETLSSSLLKRLDDGLNITNEEIKSNRRLEEEYTLLKVECINKTDSAVKF